MINKFRSVRTVQFALGMQLQQNWSWILTGGKRKE